MLSRVCVAGFVLLAACSREREPAVGTAEREFARAAVERLRSTFNQGACEAVEIALSTEARKREWLATCQQIREEWGTWSTFSATDWQRPSATVVGMEGTAEFAGGKRRFASLWDLSYRQPRMLMLFFSVGKEMVVFPSREPEQFILPLIPPHAPAPPPWATEAR